MENEQKTERFIRVAERRTKAVLRNLRILGNCGNKGNYSYTAEQVKKIFSEVDQAVKEARGKFHLPKDKEINLPNFNPEKESETLNKIISTFKFINQATEWKTYKNDNYDFEIDYPSNLTPHVNEENGFSVAFYSGDIYQLNLNGNFSIVYVPSEKLSAYYCYDVSPLFAKSVGYNCINEYTYVNCGTIPECDKIENIGNYKAIKFDEIGGGFHYLVKNNNTYLRISYYTGKTINQSVLDKMLSSFKFTK